MALPTDSGVQTGPDAVVPQTKQTDYFGAVIAYLGVPDTIGNRDFLEGWAQVENTKAKWNPLATSQDAPGATNFNSIGVKNYPSAVEGAQATAQTIKSYPNIMAALQTGSPIVGGITAGITHDFGIWVSGGEGQGTAKWQATATKYAQAVWNNAQGDPSGRGAYSGYGVGNYPLGTGKWSTPGGAAKTVGEDVLSALGLTGLAKDALYIAILIGGGLILIVGFILIGADIGLAVFARTKASQKTQIVVNQLPGNRNKRAQIKTDQQARVQERSERTQEQQTLRQLRIERERHDKTHRAAISKEQLNQQRAKTRDLRERARGRAAMRKRASGELPKGY